MAKTETIAFRAKNGLKGRLEKTAKAVRLNPSQLAEACVEALVDYIESNGEVTLPLAVVPESQLKKLLGKTPRETATEALKPHPDQLRAQDYPEGPVFVKPVKAAPEKPARKTEPVKKSKE